MTDHSEAFKIDDTQDHELDGCRCGDYRRDHLPNNGACKFNKPQNIGHLGAPNCDKFQLSERYTEATS